LAYRYFNKFSITGIFQFKKNQIFIKSKAENQLKFQQYSTTARRVRTTVEHASSRDAEFHHSTQPVAIADGRISVENRRFRSNGGRLTQNFRKLGSINQSSFISSLSERKPEFTTKGGSKGGGHGGHAPPKMLKSLFGLLPLF